MLQSVGSQRVRHNLVTEKQQLVKMEEKALKLLSTFNMLKQIIYQLLVSQLSTQSQDILIGRRRKVRRKIQSSGHIGEGSLSAKNKVR